MSGPPRDADFDAYAEDYDAALDRGISVSGEDKDYFARGRLLWTSRRLRALGVEARRVLDFGCGTGSAVPHLQAVLHPTDILGVDVSARSLERARKLHGTAGVDFQVLADFRPSGDHDLAFCNGVFHHIPITERAGAIDTVRRSLKPGGSFALWENNPWNPGTKWIMKRIPFDRDAITLTPPETRRMLQDGGFEVLGTDFLFIFPRALAFLRGCEPWVCKLPLGAQYLTLARRPA